MRSLFQLVVTLALVCGALALPAAKVLDRAAARDAILVQLVDENVREINRLEYDPDGATDLDVLSIYGSPFNEGKPVRIVFADETKFIRPVERPEMAIYGIKDETLDKPVQMQMVDFIALRATQGGLGLGVLGLLILLFVWKKKQA